MCVNASAARVCFLCQPTAADMRWSVIGFKLQKHESSFKHLLFTASAKMWCDSAKRAHGMVFWEGGFSSQRCWKSSRDFTDGPQTDKVYLAAVTARPPDLNELTAVSNILLRLDRLDKENTKQKSLVILFECCSIILLPFFAPRPQQLSQPDIFQRKGQIILKSNFGELIALHQLLLYLINYKKSK